MKPWVVTVWGNNMRNIVLVRRTEANRNTGVFYTADHQREQHFTGEASMQEGALVWFADTEYDANQLANSILDFQPTVKVLVSKTTAVVQRTLGPVQRSEFSEKGLLPA